MANLDITRQQLAKPLYGSILDMSKPAKDGCILMYIDYLGMMTDM